MVAQSPTVDLSEPLVFQVGHLGGAYQEWVHKPIISKEGPRFFANDFCELFGYQLYAGLLLYLLRWDFLPSSFGDGWWYLHLVFDGVYSASLSFHMKTKSYWGNTIHYLFHGCHHKHPMDNLRLVFPAAAAAVLCIPSWTIVRFLSTPSVAPSLFAGVLLGYVMYDLTHYFSHHGKPSCGVANKLKTYHMHHHLRVQVKGFGITNAFWDKVFKTYPS